MYENQLVTEIFDKINLNDSYGSDKFLSKMLLKYYNYV